MKFDIRGSTKKSVPFERSIDNAFLAATFFIWMIIFWCVGLTYLFIFIGDLRIFPSILSKK